MVRQNQILVRMSGWAGGLNTESDPFFVEQDESQSLLNVDIGITGEIEKRKGYSKWSTSDPAGMSKGESLWHYRSSLNNFFILRDTDGDVWHVNADSGTTLTASQISGPVDLDMGALNGAVVFDDIFYISDKATSGKVYQFDGTTWSEITDNTLNGSGTEFPNADILHIHGPFLFAGGFASASLKDRVHYSSPGDANTWPTNNFFSVNPKDDGAVRGMITFKDVLLIFKDKSLHALAGTDEDTFTLFPVSERFGTLASKTIVSFGDRIIWFDHLNGVMSYDGSDIEMIDRKINFRIFDNADLIPVQNPTYAFGKGERYYLSFEWTPGGRRTFVYDLHTDSWTEWDYGPWGVAPIINVSVSGTDANDLYAVQTTDATKGIWKIFDTENDESSAVSSQFTTTWFSPSEGPMQEHRLLKALIYFRPEPGSTAINMTIELYTNYNTSTIVESVTINVNKLNSNQVYDNIVHFENNTGNVFQLKITHNTTGQAWQLNAIDFLFVDRKTPPGKDV